MLQLVIGSSAVSLGVLLGTYMGGMCLGSLFFARFVPVERNALKVYAALEAGTAVFGLGVFFGLPLVEQLYTAGLSQGLPNMILRGLACAICLLPPTVLMGATLPAISRWVTGTPNAASWWGYFYGANIAGGVVGCFAAGFYLLRIHDMGFATYVAVGLNVAVAAVSAGLGVAEGGAGKNKAILDTGTATAELQPDWPVYLAVGISGLCASGGGSGVDANPVADAGPDSLHVFDHPGSLSGRVGVGRRGRIGHLAFEEKPALVARNEPAIALRYGGLGGIHACGQTAVLGGQPEFDDRPLAELSERHCTLRGGGAAGSGFVGRKLPAGAGEFGACGGRSRETGWEDLRSEHRRSDHWRAVVQPGVDPGFGYAWLRTADRGALGNCGDRGAAGAQREIDDADDRRCRGRRHSGLGDSGHSVDADRLRTAVAHHHGSLGPAACC